MMLDGYWREAEQLLLEGATPAQVDNALENFGFAMGPQKVSDLEELTSVPRRASSFSNGRDVLTHTSSSPTA